MGMSGMRGSGRLAASAAARCIGYREDRQELTLNYIVSLTLVFLVVFKIGFVPETMMQVLKCSSIGLLFFLHREAARSIPHFWAVALLVLVQPGCTFFASGSLINATYALVNGLCLVSLLLTFKSLSVSHGAFRVLDSFFWALFVVSLANDVSVFLSPLHEASTEYLLGNKFAMGYTHMFLLGIYATLLSRKSGYVRYNWGLFWLLFVESIAVIDCADTMTCMVGIVAAVVIAIALPRVAVARISTGTMAVTILVGINVVFFGTGMMLENEFVRHFITDVLGRSLNLTGRTMIYDDLDVIIQASPYVGWGYGTSVVRDYVGYGNAQNGLMELMVTYGVIGTMSFLSVLLVLLPSRGRRMQGGAAGLVGSLYGMFFASLVEISFGIMFYLMLSVTSVVLADINEGGEEGRG